MTSLYRKYFRIFEHAARIFGVSQLEHMDSLVEEFYSYYHDLDDNEAKNS
jgi:hypothetical protein